MNSKIIVQNGKVGFYCFLLAMKISVILLLPRLGYECVIKHIWWILLLHYAVLNAIICILLKGFACQVGIRSAFLGFIFAVGLFILDTAPPSWRVFGCYMCFMAFFHFSEFLTIAVTNPRTLSIDSFILNHSVEYWVAAVSSWSEFFIERWLFPGMKQYYYVSLIGVVLCIGGEILRKLAMLTAKTNFNHLVQSVREEGHQLVTHGVYRYCRHPSYVGWFYWSIGTQVVLVNPLCIVAYTLVSWKFFRDRIEVEEATLLSFFREDYYHYQKKVPTGLPYISGYRLEL